MANEPGLRELIAKMRQMGETQETTGFPNSAKIARWCADELEAALDARSSSETGAQEARYWLLRAKFSDLAVELEKHSNDHIHDEPPGNLQAAIEGVCADRINAILKQAREDRQS